MIGEPPWWGSNAVSGTLALTDGATRAVGTTRTSDKSHYSRFVDQTQTSSPR
jgi:hypothetical protein